MRTLRPAAALAAGALAAATLWGGIAPAGAVTAAADPAPTGATTLDWLARELDDNAGAFPSTFPGITDWGLTIDAILALELGGRGQEDATTAAVATVVDHLGEYVTGGSFDPDAVYANAVGKALLMAELAGLDVHAVGGLDLEAMARADMQTSGPDLGRFSDHGSIFPGDFSNGLGQALNLLALARTPDGAPAEAVAYLEAQQCPGGSFRLRYETTPGCTSAEEADTDATALALQALLAQPVTVARQAAIEGAIDWLLSTQDLGTGGFGGAGPTAQLNSNSTGLVAQALDAAGQHEAAAAAQAYVSALVLTPEATAGTPVADEVGAIAYDAEGHADAISAGIDPTARDEWRRASSQAVLAFGLPPFGDVLVPEEVVALPPARLLDTRAGATTIDGQASGAGAVPVDGTVTLQVAGRGGVPADATSAVLTVVVDGAKGSGHVRAWPCDRPRPNASSLNFTTGAAVAGTVITGLSATGTACLYVAGASADVIADVAAYLPPTAGFSALVPARLLDTRAGAATIDGQGSGGGQVAVDGTVTVQVAGRGGVPADAAAAVLTVTADGAKGSGHVRVWPCDAERPLASSLNFVAGSAVANTVVAPLSAEGTVCAYVGGSATDVIVDVAGQFPVGTRYQPLVPARVLDTRAGASTVDGQQAGAGAVAVDGVVTLPVTGRGGVPADATSVVLNVTAVEAGGAGHVRVWACDQPRPFASSLNFTGAHDVANAVVTAVSAAGTVCLYVAGSSAQLVVDVSGAFV